MDKIEEQLRKILAEELRVDLTNISSDDYLSDVNIDSDDISYLFIPAVENFFNNKFSVKQWGKVGSIREIADMVKQGINDTQKIQKRKGSVTTENHMR